MARTAAAEQSLALNKAADEDSAGRRTVRRVGDVTLMEAMPSSSVAVGGGVGTLDLESVGGDGQMSLERTATTTSKKDRKIGHRKVDPSTGAVTFKKVSTDTIMGSIQLGIGNSVGSLAMAAERDVLLHDFEVITKVNFPGEGTTSTPSHQFGDFRFKTYAPFAFRYFRKLFKIEPEDFLSSVCTEPLRELSNAGASGSIFYLSWDDQFIIKTVQHKEAEFLQKLLPGYYMNLNQNPRTLLPKFFGLYCYQSLGKNIRIIVMNNLLPSTIEMHLKYDLKGSTYKRKAAKHEVSKASPTLKDLDFIESNREGVYLESSTYEALMRTISRDCLVLESFKIMDYSMLIGVHNIALAEAGKRAVGMTSDDGQQTGAEAGSSSTAAVGRPAPSSDDALEDSKRAMSAADAAMSAAFAEAALGQMRRMVRQKTLFSAWESINANAIPIDLGDDYPAGGIPARNAKGEPLLIFLGIIDILQSYRLFKKLEHTWKSVLHDGDTISVHRPGFYATRFQDFMRASVFKKIPSLDLPEVKGPHRKFRSLVHTYMALKHSPSKAAALAARQRDQQQQQSSRRDRKSDSVSSAADEKLTTVMALQKLALAKSSSGGSGPAGAPAAAVSSRPDIVPDTPEPSVGGVSPGPLRASIRRLYAGDPSAASLTSSATPAVAAPSAADTHPHGRPGLVTRQGTFDSGSAESQLVGSASVKDRRVVERRLFASSTNNESIVPVADVAAPLLPQRTSVTGISSEKRRSTDERGTRRSSSGDRPAAPPAEYHMTRL